MNSENETSIVAPAMRFVQVSNLQNSLAFYSERLGFVERELQADYGMYAAAELTLGSAHLQLCPTDKSVEPRILFVETDDVSRFRETSSQRGGNPCTLQRVNWIKMEMFEVRDPDGNTIWFGQSFHQPDQKRPHPMVEQLLPHLPVDDVPAAVRYYCETLGFAINYAQDDLGVMYRDRGTLLLIQRTEQHKGIGSCTAYIENADKLHVELAGRGANILGPPISRPWGLRDFTIADHEGNRITFAQPFE